MIECGYCINPKFTHWNIALKKNHCYWIVSTPDWFWSRWSCAIYNIKNFRLHLTSSFFFKGGQKHECVKLQQVPCTFHWRLWNVQLKVVQIDLNYDIYVFRGILVHIYQCSRRPPAPYSGCQERETSSRRCSSSAL